MDKVGPFTATMYRNMTVEERNRYGLPQDTNGIEALEQAAFERGCDVGYDEGFEDGRKCGPQAESL